MGTSSLASSIARTTLALALTIWGGTQATGQPADLIFHNATVWTVDDANPTARAVAIKDGRFLTVGTDEAVLKHRGPTTPVIDLGGRFVLPGFIDTHVHFALAAAFLEFNLMTVTEQPQFVRRVEELIQALPDGEWIVGGYWSAYDQWALGSAG